MSQRCLVYGWGNEAKPHSLYFPSHWSSTSLPLIVYLTAEEAILQCGYELICRSRYEDSVLRRCIDRALVFRTGINVNVMAAGRHMLVFATQDAVVWTIGLNTIKPWNKSEKNENQEPMITSVASGTHVSKIAVGDFHCLLVATMSGQLFSFGRGSYGELGNGEKYEWVQDPTPVLMPPGESVVSISAGSNYSAIISSSGSIYTCGSGAYYRLGIGTDEDCIIPTRVFSLDNIGVSFGAGQNPSLSLCCCATWHTVALVRDTQDVYVWGWNKFGQAGGSVEEMITQPRRMACLDSLLNDDEVQSITCGSRHTAILTTSGRVIIMGRLGRQMGSPSQWEGDCMEDFTDAAPRVLPLEGRATGISSSLWSLGVVIQNESGGYFPQPSQFS
eukprot:gene2440-4732_t